MYLFVVSLFLFSSGYFVDGRPPPPPLSDSPSLPPHHLHPAVVDPLASLRSCPFHRATGPFHPRSEFHGPPPPPSLRSGRRYTIVTKKRSPEEYLAILQRPAPKVLFAPHRSPCHTRFYFGFIGFFMLTFLIPSSMSFCLQFYSTQQAIHFFPNALPFRLLPISFCPDCS